MMVEKAVSSTTPESPVCVQVDGDQVTAQAQQIFSSCLQAHWTIQCPVVVCQWDHCNPGTIYRHQYRTKTKWLSKWALCSVTFTLSYK